MKKIMDLSSRLYYFAYGSNMLTQRMHINNPTAEVIGSGKLKNHRLAFMGYADTWKGSSATIVEDDSNHVWGVVWSLPKEQVHNLDKQEVNYETKSVEVELLSGQNHTCRTYFLAGSEPSEEQRPSPIYKAVMVKGATEQGLPTHYLQKLRDISDNGFQGQVNIRLDL